MSDAYQCDRCGDLDGGDPGAKLITKNVERPGFLRRSRSTRPSLAMPGRRVNEDSELTAEWAELCEECAEAFDEFWEVNG